MEVKLNNKEIRDLEKFILKRIEEIVFEDRHRPSGKSKVGTGVTKFRPGGYSKDDVVEDNTGKLRQKLRANKNFIKQVKGGFDINLKMIDYFKWLDDGRRDELNWYFGEAFFTDEKIIDKIKEILTGATKRIIINIINEKIED